jgi:hypothetical protein
MSDEPAEGDPPSSPFAKALLHTTFVLCWTFTAWNLGRYIVYSWGYHWERGAIEAREEAREEAKEAKSG